MQIQSPVYTSRYSSPVGTLTLGCTGDSLIGLWIEGQKFWGDTLPDFVTERDDVPVLIETRRWIENYFAGKKPGIKELPLAPIGSEFQHIIWSMLCNIPYGTTVSYGELASEAARIMKKPSMSSQAVGGAVEHNHISIIIPCHRVIGADGNLTGYAGGIDKKIMLLKHEGINFDKLTMPPVTLTKPQGAGTMMFPPLPEEDARNKCNEILSQIENGKVALQQIAQISEERGNNGVMIGVLTAHDNDGKQYVLETVSGISKRLSHAVRFDSTEYVFVEPIVSSDKIDNALEKNDGQIHVLTEKINNLKAERKTKILTDNKNSADNATSLKQISDFSLPSEKEISLTKQRTELTTESLNNVFDLYSFHCIDGKVRTLKDICTASNKGKLPPTGTGDCCAPKLLDYAFAHNLTPTSMCEVFYGQKSAHKTPRRSYAPCTERCGLILPAMLGLEILYRDNDIVIINKPSGLLSVPGKEIKDSAESRLRVLFPGCIEQPAVHRLDMETSGILILALNKYAHRALNMQFAAGTVQKRYTALLDGNLVKKGIGRHGTMTLFFRPDFDNKPRQMWDQKGGKESITEWNIIQTERYTSPDGSVRTATRVQFLPHTGRTHQLRLASADSHGFSVPVIGDSLYGTCAQGERLMLHAEYVKFTHPVTGQVMEVICPANF